MPLAIYISPCVVDFRGQIYVHAANCRQESVYLITMPLCAAPVPHGCERARNSAPGQPKAAPRAGTPATNRAPRKPPVTNNTKSLAAYARDAHCELLILPIILAHVLFL